MDLPTTRHDQPIVAHTKSPEQSKSVSHNTIFEKISFYLLLATLFLAPLAFIPSAYAPLDVVKTMVIACGVLLSALFYCINLIKSKNLSLPKGPLAYTSYAVVISVIISTLVSTNPLKSFFGQGFELGTGSLLLLMIAAIWLVAALVEKNKERLFSIYTAIFASFIILALFHIIRLMGDTSFMNLGILSTPTSTILGKWYDLAIFSGVIGFLSLVGIKFLTLGRGMKILLSILTLVCGVIMFAINFTLAWWAIAIVVLALGIFEYFSRSPSGTGIKKIFSRISILTLIVLVIAIVGIWKNGVVAAPISNSLGISHGELILPWQMTLDVTADTLKSAPLFGSGPNRFGSEFLRYRPLVINPTPYWASEFNSGFGTLPTYVTTQGIVGFIVWALFFIFFIKFGIGALRKGNDPFKRFALVSSFLGSSFLWVMNFFYIPSHTMFFLTFVMTGLFFAVLAREGYSASFEFVKENSKIKRYAFGLSALLLVITIAWLGSYIKKAVALAYFEGGIKELNTTRSVGVVEEKFNKALFWNTSDVYYQALSETVLMRLGTTVQEIQKTSSEKGTQPGEAEVKQVTDLVTQALDYTQKAIDIDPTNYYNHVARARVLETAANFKIPNAYDNAKTSYANALALNPANPALYLALAKFEASQGKLVDAQQFIGRALQLKQNYIEAIFLLSQIQVSNGQIKDAIISAQVATQINPSEPLLFFQLGLLYYNDKNYTEAASTFAKAVDLNNQYANARYFLGLSYSRLGKNADAIAQFEELAKTNPDSQEVVFILSNLKAGKSPFTDAVPPIDNAPEKRKTLPVDEKTPTSKTSTKTTSKATKVADEDAQ